MCKEVNTVLYAIKSIITNKYLTLGKTRYVWSRDIIDATHFTNLHDVAVALHNLEDKRMMIVEYNIAQDKSNVNS